MKHSAAETESHDGGIEARKTGRRVSCISRLRGAIRSRRFCLLPLTVAFVLFVTACQSTNLAPIGSATKFIPAKDEEQLWEALHEAKEKVLPPKSVYNDPNLEVYLTGIARRVMPAGYEAAGGMPITVKVRKDPRVNAAAMAPDLIIVHTGLISKAENEAQLAGVLAHEVAHITHRHQIRHRREMQNQQAVVGVIALVGLLAITAAAVNENKHGRYAKAQAISDAGGSLLVLGLNIAYVAMVSGYSRDMEREADKEAVRTMAKAGYPPRELGNLMKLLLKESNGKSGNTFFWASHPSTRERIETVEKEALKHPVVGRTNVDDFERKTSRVRLANASLDAYRGRWEPAMQQAWRATATLPEPRRSYVESLMQAELYRAASLGSLKRHDELQGKVQFTHAETSFTRIIALPEPDRQADGYLGLGHLYYDHRSHRATHCKAKDAYVKYLELRPEAKNAAEIRTRIDDLGLICP